jgi:hypothetical protein
MSTDPELPGGEVPDTGAERVRIGDTELQPLPGGDVEDAPDPVTLHPLNRRLLVQELVRAGLSLSLLLLLGLVVVLAFDKVGTKAWPDAKEFLDVVIPGFIGLLGTAMGFYLGSRR